MDAGNARSLVLLIETHDWDSVRVDALIIVNVNLVDQGLRAFLFPSSRLDSSCATILNLMLAMKECELMGGDMNSIIIGAEITRTFMNKYSLSLSSES